MKDKKGEKPKLGPGPEGELLITIPMSRLKEIGELPQSERESAIKKLVREIKEEE